MGPVAYSTISRNLNGVRVSRHLRRLHKKQWDRAYSANRTTHKALLFSTVLLAGRAKAQSELACRMQRGHKGRCASRHTQLSACATRTLGPIGWMGITKRRGGETLTGRRITSVSSQRFVEACRKRHTSQTTGLSTPAFRGRGLRGRFPALMAKMPREYGAPGSAGRIRTYDQSINSRLLYR